MTQSQSNNISKNIFTGRWQIVCWKVNDVGGWKPLKGYIDSQCIWFFQANGKLMESNLGDHIMTTKYRFYPDENLLSIEHSDYTTDGFLLACIEERYRVKFLSERYVMLYDLEEVEVEPDDYTLMLELEKL